MESDDVQNENVGGVAIYIAIAICTVVGLYMVAYMTFFSKTSDAEKTVNESNTKRRKYHRANIENMLISSSSSSSSMRVRHRRGESTKIEATIPNNNRNGKENKKHKDNNDSENRDADDNNAGNNNDKNDCNGSEFDSGGEDDQDAVLKASQKKKAERELRREYMRQIKEEKLKEEDEEKKKKEEKTQSYQEKIQKRDQERQKKELEHLKLLEEKKKKEQEEYNQWKALFSVDESGETCIDDENETMKVEKFISYIKMHKYVELDDLSLEFHMNTQNVIDRIKDLEKTERLSGVFDDRGKYIYITPQEFDAVAEYLMKKGRINISTDLVNACNQMIRLQPTEEDRKKILKEEEEAVAKLDLTLYEEENIDN